MEEKYFFSKYLLVKNKSNTFAGEYKRNRRYEETLCIFPLFLFLLCRKVQSGKLRIYFNLRE